MATDATLNEGDTFVFTVNRGGDTSRPASVDFAVTGNGGNPADADDFSGNRRDRRGDELPSGRLEFVAGEVTKTINIGTRSDQDAEPDEAFTVTLSDPVAAVISGATAEGLILNDDVPVLAIEAENPINNEGNEGQTSFTFTVSREGVTDVVTDVDFAVTGSGVNPAGASDFAGGVFASDRLRFEPNETTKPITVNVAGDTTVEPNEEFSVTLSNVSGSAVITTPTAAALIFDDDAPDAASISIVATDAHRDEGDTFVFTVSRGGDTSAPASVDYAVTGSGSNPADANDFSGNLRGRRGDELPSGRIEFVAGEVTKTISIGTRSDQGAEPDEGFTVTLSNPVGAVISGATADGLIRGDGPPNHVPPDDVRIIVPEQVAQSQVMPGDGVPRAIQFRAEVDTVLTIQRNHAVSYEGTVLIFDEDLRSIGEGGDSERVTAALSAGKLYAFIFPAANTQQTYVVDSFLGVDTLSTAINTNLLKPVDVNASGEATVLDALLIVNELGRRSAQRDSTQSSTELRYFDVNRDGRVSALDALVVINDLADRPARAARHNLTSPLESIETRNDSIDEQAVDTVLTLHQRRANFANSITKPAAPITRMIAVTQPIIAVLPEEVDELLANE